LHIDFYNKIRDNLNMLFNIISICRGGGYRYCRTDPPHPKRNSKGLYPLHRVILENRLNRLLKRNEIAHHKNGDKMDDKEENIELIGWREHAIHHAKRVIWIKVICQNCKKEFLRIPSQIKYNIKRKSKNFCSRSCEGSFQYPKGKRISRGSVTAT